MQNKKPFKTQIQNYLNDSQIKQSRIKIQKEINAKLSTHHSTHNSNSTKNDINIKQSNRNQRKD